MEFSEEKRRYCDRWLDVITDKPIIMGIAESSVNCALLNALISNIMSIRHNIDIMYPSTSIDIFPKIKRCSILLGIHPLTEVGTAQMLYAMYNGIPCLYIDDFSSKKEPSFVANQFNIINNLLDSETYFPENWMSHSCLPKSTLFLKRKVFDVASAGNYGICTNNSQIINDIFISCTLGIFSYKSRLFQLRPILIKQLGPLLANKLFSFYSSLYRLPNSVTISSCQDVALLTWESEKGMYQVNFDIDGFGVRDGKSFHYISLEKLNASLSDLFN